VARSRASAKRELGPSNGSGSTIIRNVPQRVYFEHLASQVELLKHVASLLAGQKELAQIEEVKEGLAFQVLEEPRAVALKYGPNRVLIALLSVFMGILSAFLYVYLSNYIEIIKGMSRANLSLAEQRRASSS
jgi:hypothetical protein